MRRSAVAYLCCLPLVPFVAFVSCAGILVGQAHMEVERARRLESATRLVGALDQLRIAFEGENRAANVVLAAQQYRIPVPVLSRMLSLPSGTVEESRAASDARLAVVAGQITRAEHADLVSRLSALRGRFDAARREAARPGGAAGLGAEITAAVSGFSRLIDAASELETATARKMSNSHFGQAGPQVGRVAVELTAVTLLIVQGNRRSSDVMSSTAGAANAAAGTDLQAYADDIRQAELAYQGLNAALAPQLTGVLATRWQALQHSPAAGTLTAIITRMAASPPVDAARRQADGLAVGRAAQAFSSAQEPVLTAAVEEVVRAARQDRDAAVRHARLVVGATAVVAALTGGLVLVIGGTLRARLRLLARSATALSSGRLGEVEVPGPRELHVAGNGLNDAARSLERMLTSLESFAGGAPDPGHPATPAEGRLGAAVHAAVQRLADTIVERENLRQQLHHQATHDDLTGLPNRVGAHDAIAAAAAAGTGVAVLFVDLDHFKVINDTHGHAAGDHVLRVAAARMSRLLRAQDLLCRFGGDEFVVVMTGDRATAHAVAERIVRAVQEPADWQEHALVVGASVGIGYVRPDERVDADDILARADQAVYRAKAAGRGQVR
jgi:diguanylate cyclase (GGDEF)-like protein